MSDQRLTQLVTATALADDDLFYVVDVSDTAGSSSGTSRKVLKSTVTPEWNVVALGADNTGAADSSTAFNAASALAEADGGVIVIPPGTYLLSSQWSISAPGTDGLIQIRAYGAELTTSGAISALEINDSSGDVNGGVSVYGLKVNHRGNANATYGINLDEAWNTRLYDCHVEAHGVGASYAAVRVGNSNAADGNTGSFWTSIHNFRVRKRSGADSGDVPVGILLEGNANATNIIGGQLLNCTDGVLLSNQSGENPVPNGVLILGADFEGCRNAVRVTGKAGVSIAGPRVIACRCEDSRPNESITAVTQANPGVVTAASHGLENGDGVYIDGVVGMTELNGNRYVVANKTDDTFELSGTNTSGYTAYSSGGTARGGTFFKMDTVNAYAFAPYLSGNYLVSSIGDLIKNDTGIPITNLDNILTPSTAGEGMSWTGRTKITGDAGSAHPLTLVTTGGARGLLLTDAAGDIIAILGWTGTNNNGYLRGNGTSTFELQSVRGISASTTGANNLRGQVTLSSGTAAVSFGTAEPDANYYILLSGDAAETFTWASKATSGFTINSSNGSSTATVDWFLVR